MIGEAFGSYTIVAQLGSGSMGVVFLAEHKWIARQVAIKLLAPGLVCNLHAVRRFFNEARATSLIRHVGIVDVLDCDIDARGRAYMVMEHLEGETLADRLRRTARLPWAAACTIVAQVADALGAAHDKGIVHRDLKPENVFLVGDPREPTATRVKVLDFGVAKLLADDRAARLTMRGALVGTPEYMSPEQCGRSEEVDHRADVYALGCILFEMLSGRPLFVTQRVQDLIAAHMFCPAPSLAARGSEVPSWLEDLLARMLSKAPDQRPTSMHEVSQILRAHKPPGLVVQPAGDRVAAVVRRLAPGRAETVFALVGMLVLICAVWAARRNSVFERTAGTSARTLLTSETAPPTLPGAAPVPVSAPVLGAEAPLLPAAARPLPAGARPPHTGADTGSVVDPRAGARPASD